MAFVENEIESDSEDLETLPEPLLRFVETFNFKKYVEECVVPSEDPESAEDTLQSAHIVGQSRNGEILFAWDRNNNDGDLVTVVGVYSPQGKTHKVVYLHDCKTNICNASINIEKTLLAFTIKESAAAYEEDESMYDSFIAEIQPQGRVFTLNIPTPDFRSLQFMHASNHSPPKSRLMSKNTLTSHLLVVIPQVLISLYHFKMQQIILGAVMLDHPKQEIIQKNFAWYQWDPHTQWLYYARFEATSSKASMSGKHSLLLNCENFSVPNHPLVFTISLPLPYSEHLYSSVRTYYDSPFSFVLPVREMNLQVLYRRDGFWCACLQHCTGKAIDRTNSDGSSSEGRKIDYSIYIIHNGHMLYGQVPLTELSSEAMYIHFMLVGCFVAAYIPDVMLHLLNVGPQVDPCHHLTFGSDYSSFVIAEAVSTGADLEEQGSGTSSILESVPCLAIATSGSLAGDYDPAVVDCDASIIYECTLNVPAFFCLFKSCNETVLKEDILHLMAVGFRHHGTALSMIEHICQTPLAMWDHKLFAEFIISSSYANVYFDCKKLFARQLPLTTARTYHGKVSKYDDGRNKALLKVMQIPNFIKQLLVQSDQSLVMASPDELLNYDPTRSQPFENLCFNAVLSQPEFRRLELKSLPARLNDGQRAAEPSPGGARPQKSGKKAMASSHHSSGTTTGGLMHKFSATFGRKSGTHASPNRSSHNPLDMLTFLCRDEDVEEQLTLEASTVREQLVASLSKGLPLRSRNTAYNMVATYYNELQKQCCSLLLVIWQSLGFSSDNHPLNTSLCRSPTTKERILFELLEAYQLALLDLGLPLPMGFHTLFISIGYLALDKVQFLQYLRNGVFTPTKKFVELLLEDCDEEDAKAIFQVFCNLNYTLSEFAFSNWHDLTVQRMEQPSKRNEKHGHGLL